MSDDNFAKIQTNELQIIQAMLVTHWKEVNFNGGNESENLEYSKGIFKLGKLLEMSMF